MMSQYAFSNECAEKNDGKFILRKPNISPRLFNIILGFIYGGNIELKNLQGPDVIKLLIAADELNIQSLISHIHEFLIEHQAEFYTKIQLIIDKKNSSHYNKKNVPYDFKLLYRSSKNTQSFHRNCDNKQATIWVAKIQRSKQLIGGYNPLEWGGNCGYKNAADSPSMSNLICPDSNNWRYS
ncbi:hypothetical protein C1645_833983 [Glomus cerebriforme]|uniref:BTB domain-containing protein n=1 Tax=Glomus cerebriforme TaxID=658196 RepID=A0A397SEN7_9GLOM|nr:hypothetical protein C1645_833983 [Glomus cerebriforme]